MDPVREEMAGCCKQLQATVSAPVADMKDISVQTEERPKDQFFRSRAASSSRQSARR
jgi:hypothetical protein